MKACNKRKVIFNVLAVGILCIIMVVLTAYSAELKCDNNSLVCENEALQGEIDTLTVKIKSANNIEHIEAYAIEKLGMVYPEHGECVYLDQEAAPDANFAMSLKQQAYN